eukprot:scaffold48753_cov29-Tisochrysis_lutea.AAC.4
MLISVADPLEIVGELGERRRGGCGRVGIDPTHLRCPRELLRERRLAAWRVAVNHGEAEEGLILVIGGGVLGEGGVRVGRRCVCVEVSEAHGKHVGVSAVSLLFRGEDVPRHHVGRIPVGVGVPHELLGDDAHARIAKLDYACAARSIDGGEPRRPQQRAVGEHPFDGRLRVDGASVTYHGVFKVGDRRVAPVQVAGAVRDIYVCVAVDLRRAVGDACVPIGVGGANGRRRPRIDGSGGASGGGRLAEEGSEVLDAFAEGGAPQAAGLDRPAGAPTHKLENDVLGCAALDEEREGRPA